MRMRRHPTPYDMEWVFVVAAVVSAALRGVLGADEWSMRLVTSFQARVETYAPIWDEEHSVFVSGIGGPNANLTFEQRYRATLDSVTTSSVEGALMYLQRDCIDMGEEPWLKGCKRKNDVQVITFLKVEIANPNAALAEYQSDRFTYPEFCPFVEMKNGECIFTNDTSSPAVVIRSPAECKQFNGRDGQPNIGPCVGAEAFPTDNIAPYFDTVWFSYPNSCVKNKWSDGKTDACRKQFRGGLCPFGTTPDGVTCSFSYKILGFITIDELVGITAIDRLMPKNRTTGSEGDDEDGEEEDDDEDVDGLAVLDEDSGSSRGDDNAGAEAGSDDGDGRGNSNKTDKHGFSSWECRSGNCYKNFYEFCMANHTEFHSSDKDKTLGLRSVESIDFWGFPSDHRVNKNRTAFMIYTYNKQANGSVNHMTPLPLDLDAITKKNPPCYENSLACYDAHYGCKRHSYAQVCTVCREMGAKCVVKVPAYTFPTLSKAARTVEDSRLRSKAVKIPTQKASNPAMRVQMHGGPWLLVIVLGTILHG